MSFEKADQLLELATMLAGRRTGVRIDDVIERFGVSRRTAQRMLHRLEDRFTDCVTETDDTGRKRWRMSSAPLRELLTISADELGAIDLASEMLEQAGHSSEGDHLRTLRNKILALVPPKRLARLEVDHEAILEAQGLLARPGPRPHLSPEIAITLIEAVKACLMIDIRYKAHTDRRAWTRRIAPYGILLGMRRYIVGRGKGTPPDRISLYRADHIQDITLSDQHFERPPDFDIRAYAKKGFGAFQSDREFGEVMWRFSPDAADYAKDFVFHPDQTFVEEEDGSLLVRFQAAGHLEMCWFLYAWGHNVEIVAPDALRRLCDGHQRSDFPSLP